MAISPVLMPPHFSASVVVVGAAGIEQFHSFAEFSITLNSMQYNTMMAAAITLVPP